MININAPASTPSSDPNNMVLRAIGHLGHDSGGHLTLFIGAFQWSSAPPPPPPPPPIHHHSSSSSSSFFTLGIPSSFPRKFSPGAHNRPLAPRRLTISPASRNSPFWHSNRLLHAIHPSASAGAGAGGAGPCPAPKIHDISMQSESGGGRGDEFHDIFPLDFKSIKQNSRAPKSPQNSEREPRSEPRAPTPPSSSSSASGQRYTQINYNQNQSQYKNSKQSRPSRTTPDTTKGRKEYTSTENISAMTKSAPNKFNTHPKRTPDGSHTTNQNTKKTTTESNPTSNAKLKAAGQAQLKRLDDAPRMLRESNAFMKPRGHQKGRATSPRRTRSTGGNTKPKKIPTASSASSSGVPTTSAASEKNNKLEAGSSGVVEKSPPPTVATKTAGNKNTSVKDEDAGSNISNITSSVSAVASTATTPPDSTQGTKSDIQAELKKLDEALRNFSKIGITAVSASKQQTTHTVPESAENKKAETQPQVKQLDDALRNMTQTKEGPATASPAPSTPPPIKEQKHPQPSDKVSDVESELKQLDDALRKLVTKSVSSTDKTKLSSEKPPKKVTGSDSGSANKDKDKKSESDTQRRNVVIQLTSHDLRNASIQRQLQDQMRWLYSEQSALMKEYKRRVQNILDYSS